MRRLQSKADDVQERLPSPRKYLTLFIYVVAICLSFGAYTFLVNVLARDGPGESHAPSYSFAAPATTAVVRIDPAAKIVGPGETFTITVMVQDVVNLGAFQFDVTYNPYTQSVEVGICSHSDQHGSTSHVPFFTSDFGFAGQNHQSNSGRAESIGNHNLRHVTETAGLNRSLLYG